MTTINSSNYQPIQYSMLSGGSEGQINNISPGTAGLVLTSNGAGMQPSFQSLPSASNYKVNVQTFTASGTYTPISGMVYCVIQCQAPGGGGGGTGSNVTNGTWAGAGGAGGYSQRTVLAATIGASQTVTIGSVGTGGSNTGGNGTAGGTTSVGSLVSCNGGGGGTGINTMSGRGVAGAGGTASFGDINITGQSGLSPATANANGVIKGGDAVLGFGATVLENIVIGSAGNYGGGGCGGLEASLAGTNGGPGIVIITEYYQ